MGFTCTCAELFCELLGGTIGQRRDYHIVMPVI